MRTWTIWLRQPQTLAVRKALFQIHLRTSDACVGYAHSICFN
jgi:hypothetical protein